MTGQKVVGFFYYLREEYDSDFSPVMRSLSKVIEEGQRDSYGVGLKTLLISYIFDGYPNEYRVRRSIVSNYRKDESIKVEYVVRFNDFHNCTNEERKKYLYNSVIKAIELVHERLRKKKEIQVDFNLLQSDMKLILENWMRETI